jgi:pimeloyl-ACP methyl ester carboxylesterase
MPNLDVPGATLYYETFGSGPLLIIPGADGRGSIFHEIATYLSAHFTVACWDRRGYSKSYLKGSQDFANRLSTDADDAQRLIQHLSHDNPATATVFGTSSGAIVANKLLALHPECVKTLIAAEPPAFGVLPEEFRNQAQGLTQHIYDLYRANGPIAAMETFTGAFFVGEEAAVMRECMNWAHSDEIRANSQFWFEFELRQYPPSDMDLDSIFRERGKYIPAAGIDTGDGPGVQPIAVIAKVVGREILRLPGGHIGYMTKPKEWADMFLEGVKMYL